MKTTFLNRYFLIVAVLLLTTGLSAFAEEVFSNTKNKEFNQTFAVGSGDKLALDNKYGSITVTHWNRNEVSIRVEVIAKANSDSKAQSVLDRIDIELKKTGNTVSGITTFKNSININGSVSQQINYYVSMPAKLDLSVSQKYGNVKLPDNNEGKTSLDIQYGDLKAGNFTDALSLDSKYSKIQLGDLKTVSMDLAYCGDVKIGNAETVSVDTKYSNINFLNIGKISIENKYGNIKMDDVRVVSAETKYGNVSIRKLSEELSIEIDYSELNIKELNAGFKGVSITGKYANIKIAVPSKAAFRVIANNMKYGKANISGLNISATSTSNNNYDYTINGGGSSVIRLDGGSYSNMTVSGL